jgi:hypothetical protein
MSARSKVKADPIKQHWPRKEVHANDEEEEKQESPPPKKENKTGEKCPADEKTIAEEYPNHLPSVSAEERVVVKEYSDRLPSVPADEEVMAEGYA